MTTNSAQVDLAGLTDEPVRRMERAACADGLYMLIQPQEMRALLDELDRLRALASAEAPRETSGWREDVENAPRDRKIEINVRAEWSARSERWYVPGLGYPAMNEVTQWRDVSARDNETPAPAAHQTGGE